MGFVQVRAAGASSWGKCINAPGQISKQELEQECESFWHWAALHFFPWVSKSTGSARWTIPADICLFTADPQQFQGTARSLIAAQGLTMAKGVLTPTASSSCERKHVNTSEVLGLALIGKLHLSTQSSLTPSKTELNKCRSNKNKVAGLVCVIHLPLSYLHLLLPAQWPAAGGQEALGKGAPLSRALHPPGLGDRALSTWMLSCAEIFPQPTDALISWPRDRQEAQPEWICVSGSQQFSVLKQWADHKLNGRMHTSKLQPESSQPLHFGKDKKKITGMFDICCSKQRRGHLSQRDK